MNVPAFVNSQLISPLCPRIHPYSTSLGVGAPFLLAAVFTDSLAVPLETIGHLGPVLQVIAASMILMGIAMTTGQLFY